LLAEAVVATLAVEDEKYVASMPESAFAELAFALT
jgi:hypothetical protein